MQILRIAYIWVSSKQFASWLVVVWRFPGFVHVKNIAVLVTRTQYLAETLLRKISRGKR